MIVDESTNAVYRELERTSNPSTLLNISALLTNETFESEEDSSDFPHFSLLPDYETSSSCLMKNFTLFGENGWIDEHAIKDFEHCLRDFFSLNMDDDLANDSIDLTES